MGSHPLPLPSLLHRHIRLSKYNRKFSRGIPIHLPNAGLSGAMASASVFGSKSYISHQYAEGCRFESGLSRFFRLGGTPTFCLRRRPRDVLSNGRLSHLTSFMSIALRMARRLVTTRVLIDRLSKIVTFYTQYISQIAKPSFVNHTKLTSQATPFFRS
jgi:hypothetical protein